MPLMWLPHKAPRQPRPGLPSGRCPQSLAPPVAAGLGFAGPGRAVRKVCAAFRQDVRQMAVRMSIKPAREPYHRTAALPQRRAARKPRLARVSGWIGPVTYRVLLRLSGRLACGTTI